MLKLLKELAVFVFGLISVLLIFRFLLKLMAANPRASFVAWIYDTTGPLLNPFELAFPTPKVSGGFVLEFTTLFAIFTYTFIGYLIQELLSVISKNK
ncbi:MAG TPA: YggT family protein [Candidatus Woesebacteria bacterium]|nr:YggT family protein [Candidatus Woesebacteria bacterium]